MEIYRYTCGLVGTNTFLLTFPTGENYIIDAPDGNTRVVEKMKEQVSSVTAILLTHGHFDHTEGLHVLEKAFPGTPIHLGKEDWYLLENRGKGNKELLGRMGIPTSFWKDENPEVFLPYGETCCPFRVLETPGHTMGSVSLYLEEEKTLFSGDTLFQGGEGRTDLGGSYSKLLSSLETLMQLPEETLVYPGHGNSTTIGLEKRYR